MDSSECMMDFNLKEYQQQNKNTKIKVFIEYLYENFGDPSGEGEFDNDYLKLLTEDDLIKSMEDYFRKNGVGSRITGNNYITFVGDFFNMLSEKHDIKNKIFGDVALKKQFTARAKKIVSTLRETESKSYATNEQYVELNDGINNFMLNVFNEEDIYAEINKYKNGKIKYTKHYHLFLSIIPIKLIMKFALENLKIISLEMEDLDMVNNRLTINGTINLPLDEELIELFKKYLKIRKYVLELYLIEESKLFIKHSGEPYTNNQYGEFFKIMKVYIGIQAAELFANRRILELLDEGLDISTIAKLSGNSNKTCMKLLDDNNTENSINEKLSRIFCKVTNDKKSNIKKKGYLECPYCGSEVEAISEEWVLIQFEKNDKKYLACKKCRGQNGKFGI